MYGSRNPTPLKWKQTIISLLEAIGMCSFTLQESILMVYMYASINMLKLGRKVLFTALRQFTSYTIIDTSDFLKMARFYVA
jgi:hypothetical protein